MIRRPPRSTLDRSSAASDVYKRQYLIPGDSPMGWRLPLDSQAWAAKGDLPWTMAQDLSLIHISEPTRPY